VKNKPNILIAGAGVAGGSLAIRLANAGFAVTLVEREKYPRHKLCGEFVSPEAVRHFRDLGVLDDMLAIGGDRITETVFYSASGRSVTVPSEWFETGTLGALSISRAEMDLRMLNKSKELGVDVHDETTITGIVKNEKGIEAVKCRDNRGATFTLAADLFVDATGRARILAKQVEPKAVKKTKAKVVAFKTHFHNSNIEPGVCEIYSFRGGYCGVSHVEGIAVNCCFILSASVVRKLGNDPDRVFREAVLTNPRAREVMIGAEPMFDWIAVSVDSFGQKELNPAANLLTVGDAAAFIDPFTGSGMLMALESSELLSHCVAHSPDSITGIAAAYRKLHHEKFTRRLRFCEILRRASFIPRIAEAVIFVLSLNKSFRYFLIKKTRSARAV
jgi:flavin-dependent dehydrogenase